MPKFKKNPNPIMKKSSAYKMKYKHSAFPFKSSPMKFDEGTDYRGYTPPTTTPTTSITPPTEEVKTEGEEDFISKYTWRDSEEMDRMTRGAFSAQREARREQYELDNPVDTATSAIEDLDKRVTNLGG